MDASLAVRRSSRFLVVFGALGAFSLLILGCDEPSALAEQKATEQKVAVQPTEVAAPDAPPASAVQADGKPSYKEEAFQLRLEAPESVSVGKEVVFKLILTAESGYKVNDEYPLKFQFSETAQVRPSKTTVRKEDAVLEKQRAEMPLPVTIDTAGKHKVSGKLSFSVCTEERCLIEKRDLSIEVNAS